MTTVSPAAVVTYTTPGLYGPFSEKAVYWLACGTGGWWSGRPLAAAGVTVIDRATLTDTAMIPTTPAHRPTHALRRCIAPRFVVVRTPNLGQIRFNRTTPPPELRRISRTWCCPRSRGRWHSRRRTPRRWCDQRRTGPGWDPRSD